MILQLLWPDPRTAQGRKKQQLTTVPGRGLPEHRLSTQDLTHAGPLLKAGRAGTAPRSSSKLGEELGWDLLQVSWLPLGEGESLVSPDFSAGASKGWGEVFGRGVKASEFK